MFDEVFRFARHTVAFEHMTATELRLLADRAPELAQPLVALADTLDEHADEGAQFKRANRSVLAATSPSGSGVSLE